MSRRVWWNAGISRQPGWHGGLGAKLSGTKTEMQFPRLEDQLLSGVGVPKQAHPSLQGARAAML